MKLKLAVVFAVLFFASAAQADSVTDGYGNVLIVPAGSTLTSEYEAPVFGMPNGLVASFTLNDGSGTAEGQFMQGDGGEILFSEPVLDLTLTWISTGPGSVWTNTGGVGTYPGFVGTTLETSSFPGSVTYIEWTNYFGYSGIESLSYTVDPVNTPEPPTFLVSGLGLAALIGLSCCLCRSHGVIPSARK